jgi:hypothetical protein
MMVAAQTKLLAQPNDAIAAGVKSLRCQFRLQTQGTVGFSSLDVGSLDCNLQPLIVLCTLRWCTIKVPFGIAIRFAASSRVRPCASTSLTASARNSGVYIVDLMISLPFTNGMDASLLRDF